MRDLYRLQRNMAMLMMERIIMVETMLEGMDAWL